MQIPEKLNDILRNCPGTPYIIGGAVRDWILSGCSNTFKPKDYDIEVFGVSEDALKRYLSTFGMVSAVGKEYGVLKLSLPEFPSALDFSLPRRERQIGPLHTDVEVTVAPNMPPEEAASRRDLTVNALMWAPRIKQLIDFFGGAQDLNNKILRATSYRFSEDALRPLRVFQFSARFDFEVCPHTLETCSKMRSRFAVLPKARIWEEWWKWATKSKKPSKGLDALLAMGWLDAFQEVHALRGCAQEPSHHPEGDAFEHTKFVCDAMAEIADRESLDEDARAIAMFSALCHDFGKPATTSFHEEKKKVISYGHDKAGKEPTISFMSSIGAPNKLGEVVSRLVGEHMVHICSNGGLSSAAIRRCADRLYPATIPQLSRLIEADHSGRPPLPKSHPCPDIVSRATALGCVNGPIKAFITGQDVIDRGINPGPIVGLIVRQARDRQLSGKLTDRETAVEWLTSRLANEDVRV